MKLANKWFDLQRFAEEGSADSGFAATQAEPSSDGMESATPQDQGESFADLIGKGGKYHKEYQNSVREAIGKRFRNQSDNQSVIDRMNPLLQMTAARYGIKPGKDGSVDYDALEKAITDDNSLYEKEAFDRGMDVEDLKRQKMLEAENARLRSENDRYTKQAQADREWGEIVRESEAVKQMYPSFDLDEELNNENFGRLLAVMRNSGMANPVMTAYQAVHQGEIIAGGMQYAVERTKQNVSRSIASNGMRPRENGTSSRASSDFAHTDPSRFTLQNFRDIKKRAERGERITID